jgi:hypothetical protein
MKIKLNSSRKIGFPLSAFRFPLLELGRGRSRPTDDNGKSVSPPARFRPARHVDERRQSRKPNTSV